MSQFLIALIASTSILAIILATDLGHRKVTTMRMVRSVAAVAIIVAIFVHSFPTEGNAVPMQLAGAGAGVVGGLIVAALMPAKRETGGEIFTRAGAGYALAWAVLSGARVVFAYGAEHWFTQDLVRFSIENQIGGPEVYANTFVFMSLAMVLTRTGVLLGRSRRLRAAADDSAKPVSVEAI